MQGYKNMRLKLNLECRTGSRLTKNYRPLLQAAIYRIIGYGNSNYATWLHDKGYQSDYKQIKFFTFSGINVIPPFFNDNNKREFVIHSGKAELIISFLADEALRNFISGVFKNKVITLSSQGRKIHFAINEVEMMTQPRFKNVAEFKTLSPICINMQNEAHPKGKHLHPNLDPEYSDLFKTNLKTKYEQAQKVGLIDTAKPFRKEDICLEILSEPVRNMIITKHRTDGRHIKHKSFEFSFRLHAESEVLEVGYYSGFGIQNSCGLGCVMVFEHV